MDFLWISYDFLWFLCVSYDFIWIPSEFPMISDGFPLDVL